MLQSKKVSRLKENLGIVEMERFIMLINREKFDCTKWRKDLFEDMDIADLSDKANEFSKGL
ncbi:hypothetical protein [sulfur-oxidizing endosymbiont of Gigantopelta aegis]|uniref:hypothetical protein n=1 Tax=sulfur-oxidizing endosymbiont of Gigantopelta aegis TaxID=2794934 RepID=UPI001FEBA2A5|nr:hypothetical protein [sulfur-oxidizing endosymbiont of Gigantopelta aegis]